MKGRAMSSYPLVEVQITVDHMRQAILYAFSDHQDKLTKVVDECVNRAIDDFDFVGQVQGTVDEILSSIIRDAMTNALRDAFYDDEVQGLVLEIVVRKLRELLEKK